MGYSSYSSQAYQDLKATYAGQTTGQIFKNNNTRAVDPLMDPKSMVIRECRDSASHPVSIPILFWLDETGSMGRIPEYLIRNKLGTLIEVMIKHGISDPSVLFGGIGDHHSDEYPIQIGQFESGTLELNKWLTSLFLEGNGGGQGMESYLLAWYVAAMFTSTDHFEKRGKKGYLFTVGDEKVHSSVSATKLKEIFGLNEATDITDSGILAAAKQKYHVFHIHCADSTPAYHVELGWKNLLGENFLVLDDSNNVAELVASTIAIMEGADKTSVLSSLGTSAHSVSNALISLNTAGLQNNNSIIEF